MAGEWQFELLNDQHEREKFSCGNTSLDLFLHTQAGQYNRKGVGRTYVATQPNETRVLGYYTLAASAVPFEEVPKALSKRLPKHPVPTILLGRLAVDQTTKGQGLGKLLLMDALARVLQLADQIGIVAVHAHAIDEVAKGFYTHFGFVQLPESERHMFYTLETIRKRHKPKKSP